MMNTRHKTRQWAPTELPRMRRELVLAAEEAADRAVNDLKVAMQFQANEEKFADHVAKTDPAMAQRLRSHPLLEIAVAGRQGTPSRPALPSRRAVLGHPGHKRVALDASTDMPPWTPSAVIPVPIGLLIWAEDLPRIVWRGHDNSPMMPVDGVLWEQSAARSSSSSSPGPTGPSRRGSPLLGARRSSLCIPLYSRQMTWSPTTMTVTRPG